MSTLLLTSVPRPLGEKQGHSKSVGYELLHGQVTRAQGIFSPRSIIHHFSLEFIAHNLDSPTVVLQYPSEKEYIRELKRGYDYVGISFVLATFHLAKRMSALARKYAPKSKIILGGYGTVLSDAELAPYGDFICREEGVGFLRRLLGEPEKKMPYDHPVITNRLKIFSVPFGENGMIFAGLGCPNGCDFCCTSHFFKRQHIRLLPTGDDIFNVVMKYMEHNPAMNFTVLDEDFLLNQSRARRFLELVRSSGVTPSMFVFSSVKALSQYDVKELVEMGISGLWIGYEGKHSNFEKQKGRNPQELFTDLRAHGIVILASMVIGFDYQSPEIIETELNELLGLCPTFTQTLIYGPTPGTPFYERIMKEKRLVSALEGDRDLYYKRCTGFYGMVRHPKLSSRQLEHIQAKCFRMDFEKLGPSILRSVENWFLGYQKLYREKSETLRRRAERYRKDIIDSLPIFLSARLLGPTRRVRRQAGRLYRQVTKFFGKPSFFGHLQSLAALTMALWTALTLWLNWFQHPGTIRISYRFPTQRKS
ncbi:MAG: hypothetical protein HY586_02415 [Candidatus Omnitrophica bacterium]|nr:hypothetical protein [Candidatus Omnitrophota bacterium]